MKRNTKMTRLILSCLPVLFAITFLKSQTSITYTVDLYYDTNNNKIHDAGEPYLNNGYNIVPVRGGVACGGVYSTGTFYGNCPGALFGGNVQSCSSGTYEAEIYDIVNIIQPGIPFTGYTMAGNTSTVLNIPLKPSAASELFVTNISTQFRNTNLPFATMFTSARAGGIVDTASGTLCNNSTIDIIMPYKFDVFNHANCGAVKANFNFKIDGVSIAAYSFVGSTSVNVYTTAVLSTGTISVSSNTLIPYMPQFSYSVTNYAPPSPGWHSFEVDITPVTMTQTTTSVMKSMFYVSDCGQMSGNAYVDCNSNCTKDVNEFYPGNIMSLIMTNPTNTIVALPDANGSYSVNAPIGTYTISASAYPGYSISCSSPTAVTSVTTGSTYTFNTVLKELTIPPTDFYSYLSLSGANPGPGAVPGGSFIVNTYNYRTGSACSPLTSPTVLKVALAPLMSFVNVIGSTPAPSSIITAPTGDTIVWNTPAPNGLHQFTAKTATNAVIGNPYCIKSIIYPLADGNPSDNAYNRCNFYGGPFDPNSKMSEAPGMAANGDIAPGTPDLEYTIEFQNLGTGKAVNVTIKDTIDTDLDLNTLQILSSSYPVQVQSNAVSNIVDFRFANINLLPAVTNEPASHGYVRYKINLKPGLPVGTVITNRAHIYFDYNSAVATNKTINTITSPLGINEVKTIDTINLYPNPTNGNVTVSSGEILRSVQIYNITGELMLNITNMSAKKITLDLQTFGKGLYFMRTETKDGKSITKKIILE
jgi:hypothetical protein